MSSKVAYAPVGTPASAPVALIPEPPWPEPLVRLALGVRLAVPGLVLATVVAFAATALGERLPILGAPVLALVIGMSVASAIGSGERLGPGIAFAARSVLQCSIVVLGATMSLSQVVAIGLGALPVMLGTLAVALLGAWGLGRLLGVRGDTQLLIGVGTAICGASAIAAAGAVLKPKPAHLAYAIGTIITCNVIAVLTFPAIGEALEMTQWAFGLWAGTAINDTSSVVAAGYSYGPAAGGHAVVVKLTRVLALVPIVLVLALVAARRDAWTDVTGAGARWHTLPWRKIVPLFLVGFVAAACLASLGVVPTAAQPHLTLLGVFMITMALAGIGLSLDPRELRAAGHRPLVLGALLWVLVAASSLGLQALTGSL